MTFFAGESLFAGSFVKISSRDGRVYRARQDEGYDFVTHRAYAMGDRMVVPTTSAPQIGTSDDVTRMADLVHELAMVIDPGGDLAAMVEDGVARIAPELLAAYAERKKRQEGGSA